MKLLFNFKRKCPWKEDDLDFRNRETPQKIGAK